MNANHERTVKVPSISLTSSALARAASGMLHDASFLPDRAVLDPPGYPVDALSILPDRSLYWKVLPKNLLNAWRAEANFPEAPSAGRCFIVFLVAPLCQRRSFTGGNSRGGALYLSNPWSCASMTSTLGDWAVVSS
jgi:hypothetical protein